MGSSGQSMGFGAAVRQSAIADSFIFYPASEDSNLKFLRIWLIHKNSGEMTKRKMG